MTKIRVPLNPIAIVRLLCLAPLFILFLAVFLIEQYPEVIIAVGVIAILISIMAIVVVRTRNKTYQLRERLLDDLRRPARTLCELCFGTIQDGKCLNCGALKCPYCSEMNWKEAQTCKSCGKQLR